MSLHLAAGVEAVPGYVLVRKLGKGGFGEVWEATAPGGVRVALKFIRLDADEAAPELRALEVIRDVRHPFLLDVQFTARVEDDLIIAMPLCDASLLDRLRACQAQGLPGIPREELLGYMDDVARAVDFLNEPRHRSADGGLVGIQHRDIKPHNIFLVGGSVRLADFGLAKALEGSRASHTGSMSPHYVAPEELEGRVSSRSDQYSLAATYAQLRCGRLPFTGSLNEVIAGHLFRAPDLSCLPDEERAVVARALAKNPEERWPTCRAFARGLAAARAEDVRRPPLDETKVESGTRTAPPAGTTIGGVTKLPETLGPPPLASPLETSGFAVDARAAKPTRRPRRPLRVGLAALASVLLVLLGLVLIFRNDRDGADADGKMAARSVNPIAESPKTEAPAPPRSEAPKPPPAPVAGVPTGPPAPAVEPPKPAATEEPPKRITNSIGMRLALIPAGEFLMGTPDPDRAFDDEKPQHPVRITRPFYLGVTEVTQGQYRGVTGEIPSIFKGPDDLPVENVRWLDAARFCNDLSRAEGLVPFYRIAVDKVEVPDAKGPGYRLPTEAEWEYACRAGSPHRYTFGDDPAGLGEFARFSGNSDSKTHPVGQKRPNAFGLFDMHGNVWEWCSDWYDPAYYAQSPRDDPLGPVQAAVRVARGGGWFNPPHICRSARRIWSGPGGRNGDLGFRVARVQSGR